MTQPFVSFAFPATSGAATRTMPARLDDVFNVKDFGAYSDGTHATETTTAIRAGLTAMWGATGRGGILFFPPGQYLINGQIDITNSGLSANYTNGIIRGAGRGATTIIGDIPNGFVFYHADAANGPNEISNLSLYNASTWVGSGALCISNSSALIENVNFTGMIGALVPYNAFALTFRNCTGSVVPDATTGYNGTIAISGYSPHIYGWRSTNPYMIGLGSHGNNGTIIQGVGIENCNIGIQIGLGIGWASSCTVSGDILTVGGTLGATAGQSQFPIAAVLAGHGLTLPTWGYLPDDTANNGGTYIVANQINLFTITGITRSGTTATATTSSSHGLTGTKTLTISGADQTDYNGSFSCNCNVAVNQFSYTVANSPTTPATASVAFKYAESYLTGQGFAGTYRLNATFTIATPIPILSHWARTCEPFEINTVQTEACYYGVYTYNGGAGRISGGYFTGTPTECVSASGVPGYTSHSGLYIKTLGKTVIESVHSGANGYAGGFYIDPAANIGGVSFKSCVADKQADVVTTATISNGSGGAGTILNVTAVASGSSIGIGMSVTGTSVTTSPVTVITGNAASDGALTGTGTTGTYRVNNSQNLSSRTITIHTQADWVMPTSTASKAGLSFENCYGILPAGITTGLNSLGMTFTCLPGQAGADGNLQAVTGAEYTIVDCNTTTWGATAAGGGANNIKVRYNGTNWTVVGK
jgi:hypothetical protein